jgi:hypothetical protein
MRWSPSKLNRIETGSVTVQALEVEALLKFYGVTDEEQVAALTTLAVVARERNWWNKLGLGREFQQFVAYEAEAACLKVVHALYVPGLLQTREYALSIASAILRKEPNDPEVIGRVDLRIDRQKGFFSRLEGSDPPSMVAVLDEAVLQRHIGGNDVMRAQLQHLMDLAERPFLTLAVMPLRFGAHAGLAGSFEVLEFPNQEDNDVVYVESAATDILVKDKSTEDYQKIVEALVGQAQTGDDAVKIIEDIHGSLGR